MREDHIHFVRAMHSGYSAAIYDGKIKLNRQEGIDAAFSRASIDERANLLYSGLCDARRPAVVWVKTNIDEKRRTILD